MKIYFGFGHLFQVIDHPNRQPVLRDTDLCGPVGADGAVSPALLTCYREDAIETLKWVVDQVHFNGRYFKSTLMSGFERMAEYYDHTGFKLFFNRAYEGVEIYAPYLSLAAKGRAEEEARNNRLIKELKEELEISEFWDDLRAAKIRYLTERTRTLMSKLERANAFIRRLEYGDTPGWFIKVCEEMINLKKLSGDVRSNNIRVAYHLGTIRTDKETITDDMIDVARRVPFWHLLKCERSGLNYVAPCPFHNEKNPSFNIYPDTNRGHCHGCGRNVDTIQFIIETRKLNFNEAVKLLLSY